MQCYKTYAATIIIANYLEIMPEFGRKLPHAAIADWMAQNDIEPEDVLNAPPPGDQKMAGGVDRSSLSTPAKRGLTAAGRKTTPIFITYIEERLDA